MRWSLMAIVLVGCGVQRLADGGVIAGDDAGLPDAAFDAGAPDAAAVDAGAVDAGAFDAGAIDAPRCGRCARYTGVINAGTVKSPGIKEASGLAASRAHPGVLYAHDDGGGKPVIFVFTTTGADLGQLVLDGATNSDWEDLALGPCPSGTCLYVGEIGDNGRNSTTPYLLYRVAEPTSVTAETPIGPLTVPFERLTLSYPGGERHNAETLMVHPATGDVYIVDKVAAGSKSSVFKASAPLSAASTNVLVKVATLGIPDGLDALDVITGGDIDACGTSVLIRGYTTLYQATISADAPFDTIFTSAFTKVPAPRVSVRRGVG